MQHNEARVSRREVLRRLGAFGLGVPVVAALLGACTSAPAAPATSAPAVAPTSAPTAAATKTKAIIGIIQEPTALDPTADATASIATTLRDNVYEGLVRLDGSGNLIGSLAKSWDVSQDAKTITFHLQSGVKWHDGSPFTAQDVKFAWERAADANTKPVNPHRDYWAPMQSVEPVDDNTIKVTLSTYSDNWLFHMAAGSAAIVSSKSAANNTTSPVGTGPFKFGTWNRGSSLTLTRNDDYWGSKAKLKDVEFRFISDADAMNNALKAGDIDAIGQVGGPEQLAQFQQDPNFTVVKGAPAGKVMVSMNETSGPLADKRVRQALYAAIDRKAWIDGVYAGYAAPIGSHATPNDGEPYYADMTSVNTYDPAKAKQLLADAQQTNLTLRLAQISAFPYAVRGTDILNSQLQVVGVSLKVEPMEFARWLQQVFLNAQDYDLTIINHVEERDIGNYANPKYYWHYNNSQAADWLKQADAEPDAAKRKDLYTRVQRQLADDAANLWICAPNQLQVLKSSFKSVQVQGISPSLYLGEAYFG
jgi:peptide/nickel transport system substrate-binding protein